MDFEIIDLFHKINIFLYKTDRKKLERIEFHIKNNDLIEAILMHFCPYSMPF